jgi:four helix bundle protein
MEGKYKDFTDLDIWKLGHEIRKDIYKITDKLPKSEEYNLKSQSRRSSCSISSNIAEGHGRYHYQENIQYCRQARGSLDETRDHLLAIGGLYENLKDESAIIINKCLLLKPKINGYISFLVDCKKKKGYNVDEKEI